MDVREKLVELLTDNLPRCGNLPRWDNPLQLSCDEQVQRIAELLIMNGVTVQEWIPVNDERKPKEGEDVLVAVFDGYDTYTDIDCLMRDGKWCFETENYKVTHWMEKPEPPKGE